MPPTTVEAAEAVSGAAAASRELGSFTAQAPADQLWGVY